ncbi:MAG: hypothetical protein JSV44_02715, partial [Candidatus Zixiibacteriota bacterium]
ILRNRLNIWLYRRIPPDLGIPLARYVSSSSRNRTSGREKKFLKDYEDYAAGKISEGYDAVLIGHTHHPVSREIGTGIYINTGDFIRHFSYVRMDEGELMLEYIKD